MYGAAAAATQYPIYGGGSGMATGTTAFYPYFQFGQGGTNGSVGSTYSGGQSYGLQYPQMFQFSTVASTAAGITGFAPNYGTPLSLAPSPAAQAGVLSFTLLSHIYSIKDSILLFLQKVNFMSA
jgi:hypothetical protein